MNNVIPGLGFHHAAFRVTDFDRAMKFYCEGLGCKVALAWNEKPTRCAMLDLGNGDRVEVFESTEGEWVDLKLTPGNWVHLALRVDDADLAFEKALAAGAKPNILPKDVVLDGCPARIAFVVGLDGEILEFFQEK